MKHLPKSGFLSSLAIILFITLTAQKCNSDSESVNASIDSAIDSQNKTPLIYTFDGDYTAAWKTVDSLNGKGLYRSALAQVKAIYSTARTDKNYPEVIKAQMHKMRYNTMLEDDDYVQAINDMDSLTQNAEFPLKQISHALTAKIYWGYYNANQYTIMNRTATEDFDNKDIRTWDLRKIAETITYHRQQSLTQKEELQRTQLTDFKAILQNTQYQEYNEFRPTLYDFLAFDALSFFESSEFGLPQADVRFVLNQEVLYAPSQTFCEFQFDNSDSLANTFYAIKIYQDLERFHLSDENPKVLIDAFLHRLKFVKNYGNTPNADQKYIDLLETLIPKYIESPSVTELIFVQAQWYTNKNNENAEKEKLRFGSRTAHQLCDKAIKLFPKSYGAKQCLTLKTDIESKSVSLQFEKNIAPNSIQKYVVNFKNVDTLHFKLLKFENDFNFYANHRYNEELIVKNMLDKGTPVKTWSETLPNKKDFAQHSLEYLLDPLDFGTYAMIASTSNGFELNGQSTNYGIFYVTNFAMSSINHKSHETEIKVYDRTDGQAYKEVKVELFTQKYNDKTEEYEYDKLTSGTTNSMGKFNYRANQSLTVYPKLTKGDDYFFSGNSIYLEKQYNYNSNRNYTTTHFFLDRKIYRPGQTVYFKGICVTHNDGDNNVYANKAITVTFRDANYQEVKKLELTTNDYGSYSGQFETPAGGMNGSMSLHDNFSSTYFRVEEYKRPKFQVNFKPVVGVFKLNNEVVVNGTADAFAGNAIDGARVKYRITRSAQMPYWCYYRYGYRPQSSSIEIANDELETNESGDFEIKFLALEDSSISAKFQPTYNYRISADVTDINGETRSNSTNVSVGHIAMRINVSIPTEINKEDLSHFRVKTYNLNGQKVDGKVKVTIVKLITPDHSFRQSNWGIPDIKNFTKTEYEKYFPRDEFDKESQIQNYPIESQFLSTTVITQENDSIPFENKNKWQPGTYKIIATATDVFGQEVIDEKYVTIFDARNNKPHNNETLWVKTLKRSVQPGEKGKILISSADHVLITYRINKNGKEVSEKIIEVNNEQKIISIPITEDDRGGLTITFSTVLDSRTYSQTESISVPYKSRNLNVEMATYRNKMLPGSEEEWKIKISGPDKEKVAAELLVSMYDESLDEFASNYHSMYLDWTSGNNRGYYYGRNTESFKGFGAEYMSRLAANWNTSVQAPYRYYPAFNMFGYYPNYYLGRNQRYRGSRNENASSELYMDEYEEDSGGEGSSPVAAMKMPAPASSVEESSEIRGFFNGDPSLAKESNIATYAKSANEEQPIEGANGTSEGMDLSNVKARTNFNETAFFYPQLKTNAEGEVIFSFTMPESLTKWKFLGFAHTKDLNTGSVQESVVTQKDLMVVPNAPRFFREKDKMVLSTKISNISDKDLNGSVQLFLIDGLTGKEVDAELKNIKAQQSFTTLAKQSTSVEWTIEIPLGMQAITYKIVAKAGDFSDGEEMTLPVLTNRMLVTESIPLYINKKGTKNFKLDKLINSGSSSTLAHEKVTLEFTSNPAWYAVQALPYMMEYPYECAEQTFSRYYANAIATKVANSSPKIEQVFETWKNTEPDALLSNLEKNQELKSLFLEETPWVMQAKSESESKRRIGLLFDLHRMKKELNATLKKIEKKQDPSGGWAWFPGMKPSAYITQHIVTGMGHLNFMDVINTKTHVREWNMLKKAVGFLDKEVLKDYKYLQKHYTQAEMDKMSVGSQKIQYLYARSYFKFNMNKEIKEAHDYYLEQTKKHWLTNNLQTEAMIALLLERYEPDGTVQDDIMKSLSELAIHNEEMGMYYKSNIGGYYWYNAPIETQALLIEAFDVVANDLDAVNELKVWLLKQKQTTHWKTTRATSEACFALLMRGTDILNDEEIVEVTLGGTKVEPSKTQAGTGYFKESWSQEDVKPNMGNITVSRKTDGVSWGGFYWQYFEDLDKITPHESPLQIKKQLFKVKLNKNGEFMTPITEGSKLEVGDKVRVRIEIHVDRDLEYVHLKDMRAAGFEPTNVLSQYKWQDGLGYYESTKDASTNFFMDYLSKGSYVFEYDLRVFHKGNFSNGVTTMQCMYAPEFSSHSEGIRVTVE